MALSYDEQLFAAAPGYWDEDPCECGEPACTCTCAEDEANERGDYLLEQMRDREHEEATS